ncbi:MAG TPA: phosphotransferase family protein [Actinomycetota bacterium]|nr:phosphotransferase family protein [Actinomycetota bacterium]
MNDSQAHDLPPLVDEAALTVFLNEHFHSKADLVVQRHQAGHSNETFIVHRGAGQEMVLRRPPLGAFLPSAHDVAREYRVLKALDQTPVRVPQPLCLCEDESVIGAPFYLMERMHGVVIREEIPDAFSEEHRRKIGEELVDSLVELHAVDPTSCGLETFGKPTGYLERQLRRWSGQLELTLPFTRPLPDLEKVGEWLRDNLPESGPSTIVHGDYKLDNVMFDPDVPPRLIAILDWEMSTLGDPLADVGWMASFWRDPEDPTDDLFSRQAAVTASPGFQRRKDLIARYADATGRDVSNLGWYVVLAIWKLAILLEGSYARHLAGMTDDPFFAEMEQGVPLLARRALEVTAW